MYQSRLRMILTFVVILSPLKALADVISPPDLPSFKLPQGHGKNKKSPSTIDKTLVLPSQKLIPALTKRDKKKGLYRIKLQWKEADKAAVFFYRGVGYIVFNKPGRFSPGTFPADFFHSVSMIPHEKAVVARFTLKANNNLLLTRVGDEWVILVGAMENETSAATYPLEIKAKAEQGGVTYNNDENEPLIAFKNPVTGDDFKVQPDINRGVDALYETPFMDVLPSYQGVAYLLKASDSVSLTLDEKEHVNVLRRQDGVPLTSLMTKPIYRETTSVEPLVDLRKYDVPLESVFLVGRRMREDLSHEKDKKKRFERSIELAKFYLATGHYIEGLGMLELLKERRSDAFYCRDDLLLMYDLARILSHNLDSESFLSNDMDLEGEPERSMILAMQEQRFGRYDVSLKHYVNSYKFIQNLPVILRNDIAIKAFEAGVESGFKKPVFEALVHQNLLTPRARDAFKYYKAQLTKMVSPNVSLQETYTKLTFSRNGKVALLSRLALVDKGNKSRKSIIKNLESLMFTWRGDVTEQRFLATLADLYRLDDRNDDALRCLRTIASYLWKFEKSHIYTKLAEDLFYKSFMAMKDEPLLKQIGFYYEFEDVVPRGHRYGDVMSRLTNLYISVGLDEEAMGALEQRIKYLNFEKTRQILSDTDYADLMNTTLKRLAELHLITGNNKKILTTLNELKPMAPELEQEGKTLKFLEDVKYLKGIAHVNMLQYDGALKALEGLESRKGKRLRADVYMAQERWEDSLVILGELLEHSKGKDIEGDFDVDAILDIAVAASHLKNKEMVQALNDEYAHRIKDPEKKQAFNIIVSSSEPVEITKVKMQGQLVVAERYGKIMDGIKKDILETRWDSGAPKISSTEKLSPNVTTQDLAEKNTPESEKTNQERPKKKI